MYLLDEDICGRAMFSCTDGQKTFPLSPTRGIAVMSAMSDIMWRISSGTSSNASKNTFVPV